MKTFEKNIAGLISLFLVMSLVVPVSGWAETQPTANNETNSPVPVKAVTAETTVPTQPASSRPSLADSFDSSPLSAPLSPEPVTDLTDPAARTVLARDPETDPEFVAFPPPLISENWHPPADPFLWNPIRNPDPLLVPPPLPPEEGLIPFTMDPFLGVSIRSARRSTLGFAFTYASLGAQFTKSGDTSDVLNLFTDIESVDGDFSPLRSNRYLELYFPARTGNQPSRTVNVAQLSIRLMRNSSEEALTGPSYRFGRDNLAGDRNYNVTSMRITYTGRFESPVNRSEIENITFQNDVGHDIWIINFRSRTSGPLEPPVLPPFLNLGNPIIRNRSTIPITPPAPLPAQRAISSPMSGGAAPANPVAGGGDLDDPVISPKQTVAKDPVVVAAPPNPDFNSLPAESLWETAVISAKPPSETILVAAPDASAASEQASEASSAIAGLDPLVPIPYLVNTTTPTTLDLKDSSVAPSDAMPVNPMPTILIAPPLAQNTSPQMPRIGLVSASQIWLPFDIRRRIQIDFEVENFNPTSHEVEVRLYYSNPVLSRVITQSELVSTPQTNRWEFQTDDFVTWHVDSVAIRVREKSTGRLLHEEVRRVRH